MAQLATGAGIDYTQRRLDFINGLLQQLSAYYGAPSYKGRQVNVLLINKNIIQVNMLAAYSPNRLSVNAIFGRYDPTKKTISVEMAVDFQGRKRILTNTVSYLNLLAPMRGEREEDRYRAIKSWIMDAIYKAQCETDAFFGS